MQGASYQLIEILAQGGMGTVYLARYRDEADFLRQVAIKLLRRDVGEPEELGRRLRDEARLLGLLSHPAIVRVDRLTQLDGRWALVMEYVDGLDLRQLASSVRVPTGVALEVVEVVADALDAAARACDPRGRSLQLQHRDIKPSNIMVSAHGEVKVLDFGVAQARFQGRESTTQSLQLGTTDYMAPERLAGGHGSPAADIFSLGVVLWEVLAGERLGQSSPQLVQHGAWLQAALARLEQLRPQAPPELVVILSSMLAWSPIERPGAALVVERCAGLAKAVADPPLRSWCRGQLRGMSRLAPGSDGLVGQVFTPGGALSAAPLDEEPSWDDRTAVGFAGVPVSTGPLPGAGEIVPPDAAPPSDAGASTAPLPAPVAPPVSAPQPASSRRRAWPLGWAVGLLTMFFVVAAVVLLAVGYIKNLEPELEPELAVLEPPTRVQDVEPAVPDREPSADPAPRSVTRRAGPVPKASQHPVQQAAVSGSASIPPQAAVETTPEPSSVWSGTRPGGSLSTAGLEPQPGVVDVVWGPRTDDAGRGVSWTDGVPVQLEGDATEVVLVDESRGFPVPGVVPAGKWFVRVRFGSSEPVVAGVVDIQGPGPVTLECDAHLSWCSVAP